VVALALVTIAVRFARPLYQTVITVLLAYVTMFLPRALIGLRASVARRPSSSRRSPAVLAVVLRKRFGALRCG
jgi:iron(III) transport system permease protein